LKLKVKLVVGAILAVAIILIVLPLGMREYTSKEVYQNSFSGEFHSVEAMSFHEALASIKSGKLAFVNSTVLNKLAETEDIGSLVPFIAEFNMPGMNSMYAIGLLEGRSVFIYSEPVSQYFSWEQFNETAYREYVQAVSLYRENHFRIVELTGNVNWSVTINVSSSDHPNPETVGTIHHTGAGSAGESYLAGYISWDSGEAWAPIARLKLTYLVYKLPDIDSANDYFVVDQHTTVYPGHWLKLHGDHRYSSKWETDKIINYVNTDYTTSDTFTILQYEPSYKIDYYNSPRLHTVKYTVGFERVSLPVSYNLTCFKSKVISTGEDWVKWVVDLNREDDNCRINHGVGRIPVHVEPSYLFTLNQDDLAKTGRAAQQLSVTINMTGNNTLQPDEHWTGTIQIIWTWVMHHG